jgi:hypothetical protein
MTPRILSPRVEDAGRPLGGADPDPARSSPPRAGEAWDRGDARRHDAPPAPRPPASLWGRFAGVFAGAALGLAAALYAFVAALDPYGLRARPDRPPTPIMDVNQRFMYPQIVRGGRYDAAAFGTSTIRLLDPRLLDAAFGARFANLGLNAGTPWEQTQIAGLFLRHVPNPKALLFGLDDTWCEADADTEEKRLTPRAFPPWLYDDDPLNDYAHLLNLRSLEIAGRVALNRLGLMPEHTRPDGYRVFTPPEQFYDLARARRHIWRAPRAAPVDPPVRLGAAEEAALRFPALAWLDDLLGRAPSSAAVVLAFMPVHVAAQPVPGSLAAARDDVCKAHIAAIGARRGATVVDFRRPSPVTTEDANYWDPLHYRLGLVERIVAALAAARTTGRDAPDGFYKVLVAPPPTR